MTAPQQEARRNVATALDATLALALFGCIPVAVKFTSANTWTIGIVRLGVAAVMTVLLVAIRGEFRRVTRRQLGMLALIGTIFFVHWVTYFLSIKISSASIAAIGLSTYGVDLMLLGALAGHGRIRGVEIVALVLAVVGAVLVVPDLRGGGHALAGMLLALTSALFYAALPIIHQRNTDISDSMRTVGQFGFALILFLLFLPKANWDLAARDWYALLYLAVGATLIAHSLWVRVTTRLSPAVASIIYYGNVPFAVVLSVVVLHDPVSWKTVAGALLIVGGAVVGLGPQLRRRTVAGPVV